MTGVNEIRSAFLDFFRKNGHEVVASCPLVPRNDPTLMFTNAGMVQFKNVFTGQEHRPYKRATTSQKCVRAGGKHNDLDNVGYTARHHTFFEMLGNFSFGDYFKDRAIELAWNLDHQGVRPRPQAADRSPSTTRTTRRTRIWKKVAGLPDSRIIRIADRRQFLAHGRHRPVRPLHGDLLRPRRQDPRRPAGLGRCRRRPLHRDLESRVHAVRAARARATASPLPKPSIDTGMGLERISAVLQGTHDNYETDLFRALIAASEDATGVAANGRAQGLASRHRRPPARDELPDRGRRAAAQRGPRLRAAPDHAPRHAACASARRQGPADVPARAGAGAADGRDLSRACRARRRSSPRR